MVKQAAWRRPVKDVLAAEQLDRFFAVRERIDAARRSAPLRLDELPRGQVRSFEELRQVPRVLEGVSGLVDAETGAFLEAGMTPAEHHWIERLVYGRWRGPLRRAGTYPLARRAAAAEIDAAAGRETDPRLCSRLKAVAGELRAREPAPPEGFDAGIHALLLSRIDDVERWSLDDLKSPLEGSPR